MVRVGPSASKSTGQQSRLFLQGWGSRLDMRAATFRSVDSTQRRFVRSAVQRNTHTNTLGIWFVCG